MLYSSILKKIILQNNFCRTNIAVIESTIGAHYGNSSGARLRGTGTCSRMEAGRLTKGTIRNDRDKIDTAILSDV